MSAEYIGAGALGSVWGVLSRDHGDESREERETLVAVMAARLGGVDLALEYLGVRGGWGWGVCECYNGVPGSEWRWNGWV